MTYVAVGGERHAMLRRPGFWHGLAAAYTVEDLTHRPPKGTFHADVTNTVTAALAGTPTIRV